ncbi:hypothetical protein GIB67_036556 [Kingdonia uniflora]|uniref:Anoctamin transmembrane domain-containing protein n=1 Tax=Kingdonia uniflora TaxID=39325 RepID=A0A7J7NZI9_9MAGN|nr:hypothetical protein GIB67_036556 [Kingdonia uniflora]
MSGEEEQSGFEIGVVMSKRSEEGGVEEDGYDYNGCVEFLVDELEKVGLIVKRVSGLADEFIKLRIIVASKFDWGTLIMVALYWGLDEVLILKNGKGMRLVTGFYALLEFWFFEYCQAGMYLVKVLNFNHVYPRMGAWRDERASSGSKIHYSFVVIREMIDWKDGTNIDWQPWVRSRQSIRLERARNIWMVRRDLVRPDVRVPPTSSLAMSSQVENYGVDATCDDHDIGWFMDMAEPAENVDGYRSRPCSILRVEAIRSTHRGVRGTAAPVAAPMETLGRAAFELEIKKPTCIGMELQFEWEEVEAFVRQPNGSLFSWCERYRCFMHLIYGIVNEKDSSVILGFGSRKIEWGPGESLLERLKSDGIVKQVFPIHEETKRKHLLRTWALNWLDFTWQPIDEIYAYFGTKIATYFAFLGMYTWWMLFPAAFGLALQLIDFGSWHLLVLPIFFVFVISWAVMFFQFWKRKNSALLAR